MVNAFDSTADVDCRTPVNDVLPTVVVPDMFCVFVSSAPRSETSPVTSFWARVVATRRRLGSTRTGKFGVRLAAPMVAPYIASEPSSIAFKFGRDWRNLDMPQVILESAKKASRHMYRRTMEALKEHFPRGVDAIIEGYAPYWMNLGQATFVKTLQRIHPDHVRDI